MGGTGEEAALAKVQVKDEQVLAYLKANPDFLVRHPEIAARLAVPARPLGGSEGGVVDLQQFMIERLRQELDQMRGCAEQLINTTRSNMSTQARTHDAALAVLRASDAGELAQVLSEELPALLDVDVIALCFETGDDAVRELAAAGTKPLPAGTVEAVFGPTGREVLLYAERRGEPAIFGDAAGLVQSFSLVRLRPQGRCPAGILGLGSRQARTFHPGQGTELLAFLARVMEHGVRRWVAD